MYSVNYIRAKNLEDAHTHLKNADDGKLLAGGMTLIPTLKQRLASPDCLIDLADTGLNAITDEGHAIRIEAMCCHVDVERSDLIKSQIPALSQLAGSIGDRQVRNRGTIGGSVANNDPAACYPAAVLGLDAKIHTNLREIEAADYFTGLFETALDDEEIITAISFLKPEAAAYMKFENPASRYAMVGVFVAKIANNVRVSITGAGQDGVYRDHQIEAALTAEFSSESLNNISIDDSQLISDIHASADYRAHLITVMTRRAIAAC